MTTQQRLLDNGTKITRYKSPLGKGHMYYADGGPEGMVLITDTYMIPPSTLMACIAWELDTPKEHHKTPIDPQPIFNKEGFRF